MHTQAPSIILVKPQLAENIGAAARAMANFGAVDLRLVSPRIHDRARAQAMACDGSPILERAREFSTLREALSDCAFSVATTRRWRSIRLPLITPPQAARRLLQPGPASSVALVFGSEQSGLSNEELYLCDAASFIPASECGSLNLAQAVVVYLYEWFQAAKLFQTPPLEIAGRLATHAEKQRVYDLLETLTQASGYTPAGRLPEFMRKVKLLFETRALSLREQKILLKLLRLFEKKIL